MELMKKKDVADMLGCSVRKVEEDMKKGLPFHKVGKLVRFKKDEVLKYYKLDI